MIKHVLFCKLKENTPENAQKMVDCFLSMKGNVPCIVDVKAGADFLHSERSFDVILEATFNSREDLEVYQADPYHCSVVKPLVRGMRTDSATVDYEI